MHHAHSHCLRKKSGMQRIQEMAILILITKRPAQLEMGTKGAVMIYEAIFENLAH